MTEIMDPRLAIILAFAALIFVVLFQAAIWASRYVKVGLNQVLIVSGRQRRLPDGTFLGFRIVKGGGTFVWPVIEKVDVLSLEVFAVEMPKTKVRTSKGGPVEADCTAQLKIKGDDASIVAAAERFLSKSAEDMKNIVRPILEKHLRSTLDGLSFEEIGQNPDALADKVQAAASVELGQMGLVMMSFTIQDVRAV